MADNISRTYSKAVCWEEDNSDGGRDKAKVSSRKIPNNKKEIFLGKI